MASQKLPFSKRKLPAKVVLSYIFDYLIIVILIAGFYALDAVEPFHQHFSLQNYTLQYPFATKERVPVPALVVIAVACPAAIIALYTLVIDGLFSHKRVEGPPGRRRWQTGRYSMKEKLWELNCGVLGLMLGVGAAFTITGALKNAIGKPRPDLIDRCQPPPGSHDPPMYGLSNHSICTQTDNSILKDGFRSFPSGHSSTAFGGLFYLSIYLAAKMHVLDSRGETWKLFLIMVPTIGAALIAGSRIMDARHHPFDVISGSLLGILCAWGAYRQYFPPVSEAWRKGRAYPIRSWGKEPLPPDAAVGVEPLRVKQATDEEARATGYLPRPGSNDSQDEHGGNVFRQQINASQRSRQRTNSNVPHRQPTVSSTYSASTYSAPNRVLSPAPPMPAMPTLAESSPITPNEYAADLSTTNPFAPPRRGREDHYGSSSEEDEAYELQPQHSLHSPQPSYAPVGITLGQDTEYHSPALAPPPVGAVPSRKPVHSEEKDG